MKKSGLIIKFIFLVIIVLFFLLDFLEFIDLRLSDILYRNERSIENEIVIVGIDDKSLQEYGRWPWKRSIIAKAIDNLSKGKPSVIGIDIIYSEESTIDKQDDESLVSASKKAGNIIYSAYAIFEDNINYKLVLPFKNLRKASDIGIINVAPDNDGILRRTFLGYKYNDEMYKSFAYKVYERYCLENNIEPVPIDNISNDEKMRFWIDYAKPPGVFSSGEINDNFGFESISIADVLSGEIDSEYFRDKIVLIGAASMGMADDYYFTPIAPNSQMYGIEVHANVINQLIDRDYYTYPPVIVQVIVMLALGIVMIVLSTYIKSGYFLPISIFLLIATIFVDKLFFNNGILLNIIYYVLIIVTEYLASLYNRLLSVSRDKKKIQKIFGRYMAPQIVKELLNKNLKDLQLGGQTIDITVLFVDIRGFTSISEKISPQNVVYILNKYLELWSVAIFEFGGTLDKYIGDCAMAFYNAPIKVDNHELAAIKSALTMRKRAAELNKEIYDEFGINLDFGVGIHTGPAVVGNIGYDFRMDYTAIGDTVNTASRLQGKALGNQILISQAVYDRVKDDIEAVLIGDMSMKGKNDKISAYDVISII